MKKLVRAGQPCDWIISMTSCRRYPKPSAFSELQVVHTKREAESAALTGKLMVDTDHQSDQAMSMAG